MKGRDMMKKYFVLCSVLMTAMMLIPLTAMEKKTASVSAESVEEESFDGVISVMKSDSGKVEEKQVSEYIVGALAAEMSMESHDEALKAQAVACYTYALYIKENGSSQELNGADISDDSSKHQGYLGEDERQKKWGDKFDEYEKKAQEIAEAVAGKRMTYEGKVILAAYHELCGGQTESAETVWGEKIPYLVSVTSAGDKLAAGYDETKTFTSEQFKAAVQTIDGITLNDDAAKWAGKTETSQTGFVKSIELGGTKVSSEDFKKIFELRSRCFTVSYSDSKFTIKTVGNGHMVGMSQYGADYMARQGSSWQEILKHYYTGIKIG